MLNKKYPGTHSLMFEFGRIVRARMRDLTQLTLPQLEVLHFVRDNEHPPMRDIADYLKVKAPTATALINELVALKLLSRTAHAADRRQIRLSLTKRGETILNTCVERKEKVINEMLNHLAPKDRKEFFRILGEIVKTNR